MGRRSRHRHGRPFPEGGILRRLLALLACLLIVLRHWENIYRIRTGQENRISFKKKG